jgi:hypothetical protein
MGISTGQITGSDQNKAQNALVSQTINQANQPKSDFAKQYSGYMQGGAWAQALQGLANGGQLGNSFPGSSGMYSVSGSVLNQGQTGQQNQIAQGYQNNTNQNTSYTPFQNALTPQNNVSMSTNRNSLFGKDQAPTAAYENGGQMQIPQGQAGAETPNPNQYTGGFSYSNQNLIPGLDPATNKGSFNDLINSGVLGKDQAYKALGLANNYDPASDPQQIKDFNAWKDQMSQVGGMVDENMNVNDWWNQFGPLGSNFQAQYPNDEVEYQNYLSSAPKAPSSGYMDENGQFVTPPTDANSARYIINGRWQDGNGNDLGPSPSSGGPNVQNSTSNLSGMNAQTARPNLAQMNMQGMNPQALQTLLQQFQAPGVNGYNPSQQLLNNPGFNQQYGQMQGLGIQGLSQALQQQIGNTGNNGMANLPGLNLGQANLQAANPQQVSAPGTQLNTGNAQQVSANNVNPATANIDQSNINPQDSAFYQAVQKNLTDQMDLNRKDLRARFGASGGTSRGTPAAFAESQFDAQALPQLAQALGEVRQQEFGNLLQQRGLGQQGNLANAGMQNQVGLANNQLQAQTGLANSSNQLQAQNQGNSALLQARGQDINNSQQNVQNFLQSVGLNNTSNLQARGQNLDLLGLGQQGALQNQSLGNQFQQGNLSTLGNLFNSQQGMNLQNYFNTIGANQNQQGLLSGLAQQAGQLGLGQNQLGSQNALAAQGLNQQGANNALQNQLGFQTNQNQANLGQNNILSQLAQFNSGQGNDFMKSLLAMQQSANEGQINRQFTGYQNLAQLAQGLALAGIPGGGSNTNLSPAPNQGLSSILGPLSMLGAAMFG